MERGVRIILLATIVLMVWRSSVNAQPVVVTNVPENSTNFIEVGELVYFTSDDVLWRTNGTSDGTIQLTTGVSQGHLWRFEEYGREFKGNFIFLSADASQIWRSDGTPSGTVLLKTASANTIRILDVTESYLFFAASDAASGLEVYRTDGTTSGTMLVKDIYPGSASGYKGIAKGVNDELYFAGNNGVNGTELWKSDGTSAGTVMVTDINPGPGDGFASNTNAFSFNNLFFFRGNTSATGMEPWVSDGTPAGTHILQDADPGSQSSGQLNYAIANNGNLYFLIHDAFGDGAADLWKTNGTEVSTTRIKTIGSEEATHDYHSFLVYQNKVYFWDRINLFADELWVTDGTTAGTNTFFNIITIDGSISFFEVVNDYLVFTGDAEGIPWNFYRSDGTREGTAVFAEFKARAYGIFPRDITKVGDLVFYADHDGLLDSYGHAYAEEDYYHLYQADAITAQSMRTRWGVNTTGSDNIAGLNGKVVFTTHNNQAGSVDYETKLWIYDPTTTPPPTASFTLVHAGSDKDVKRLLDGASIRNPYDAPINIRYNAIGSPGSVVFKINDVPIRVETAAPYSLAGDANGDYAPWQGAEPGTYTLTATPYSQAGGQGTPGESLTITFSIKCESTDEDCTYTGDILYERWSGIPGNNVSAIPVNTRPTWSNRPAKFEGPANSGTNYGARFRGYIHPPATGSYTFWIASNDNSELWLSTDENPTNKIKIASVNSATDPRQWDKFTSQKSVPVTLTGGQKYYIEALHKQGAGTDHVAVGWQLPDGTMERPIPGNRLSPFRPGASVGPTITITSPSDGQTFAASSDILIEADAFDGDDGTITKVQFFVSENGTSTKVGEDTTAPYSFLWEDVGQGSYEISASATDAEGNTYESDGVTITVEPATCLASGTISREYWGGVQGNEVSQIPLERDPDSMSKLTIFEGPSNAGTNYGSRIRGYICPPVTGNYNFWIASNDNSELWISTDDDPANKTLIAYTDRATGPREWNKFGNQRSTAVRLIQGQRYYIEALHKQGIGTDHIAVGWSLPDGTFERPIPGNRLSPFEATDAMTFADQTTSDDAARYSQINVYPNPAASGDPELTISGYEFIEETIVTDVEIMKMTGEIVFSDRISCGGDCGEYPIRVNEKLPPGLYMVKMKTNGLQHLNRLLVK